MDELREMLLGRGAAAVGFADMTAVDEQTRQGLPFAASFAVALRPEIIAGITTGPTEAYSDEYDRANAFLGELAGEAAELLIDRGHKAVGLAATMIGFDPVRLRAPFQHKTAATLAGMGWIGKCALLINRQVGSAARWATVLTDAPLPPAEPVTKSDCGDCTDCVDVCPGQACSGQHWSQGMAREDFWNAHACRDGMERINHGRKTHHDICGMCIAACPYTRDYLRREGAI